MVLQREHLLSNRPRGRSADKDSSRKAERSSSFSAEIDTLQYYSILSKSPSRDPKHSIFRRPITPDTMHHMKQNYFITTSAEKFKNVWQEKRCLRCFSKTHRASACPTYTRPTPTLCKYCHYLYHSSDKCIFYDGNGKTRPPSQVRNA